jgi:hypothetical protein
MKKILFYLIAISFISIISPISISASHLMGSDLTWKCVGQDSFLIKLVVYRDCNGIALGVSPINFVCVTTGTVTTSLSINVGIPVDITPVSNTSCTRCSDPSCSFPYGIHRYTIQGIAILSGAGSCCDIRIYWAQSARNAAITTSTGAGTADLYIEAQLNRCQNPCDNSPVFSNMPVAILCNGQDFTYSHGVYDADTFVTGGLCDSLVFNWTSPLTSKDKPIPYLGQYDYNKPIYFLGFPDTGLALPSGFHLDTETGDISFRPMKSEITIMVLNVKEYRNGKLIGIIRRDMQMIVIPCSVIAPIISTNGSPKKNMLNLGESITINFSVIDTSSKDSMFISWNKSIPNAIWSDNNGTTRTPTGTLYWKPESTQQSKFPYIFTIMVRKNSSPMNTQYSESYQIYVKKSIPTEILNEKESNKIFIYPNPSHDDCIVATSNKLFRILSAELFDTEGRLVSVYSNINSSELKIEKTELKSGNYMIRLKVSNGKTYTEMLNFR